MGSAEAAAGQRRAAGSHVSRRPGGAAELAVRTTPLSFHGFETELQASSGSVNTPGHAMLFEGRIIKLILTRALNKAFLSPNISARYNHTYHITLLPSASLPLKHLHVRILPREHPQRLDREGELVVRVRNHAAPVEHSLDRLLRPLPVILLPLHDQPDPLLERLHVRVVRLHEPDKRPRRLHDEGAGGMLRPLDVLARLRPPLAT